MFRYQKYEKGLAWGTTCGNLLYIWRIIIILVSIESVHIQPSWGVVRMWTWRCSAAAQLPEPRNATVRAVTRCCCAHFHFPCILWDTVTHSACFHAGNNPKQQQQQFCCHPLSLPLSAHLAASLGFMSCYASSQLERPPSPPCVCNSGCFLIKQVRLCLLTARRLASRHMLSAGAGLICARGVCEDGWARWHWPIFCVWPRSRGCMNRKSARCEHRSLYVPTAGNKQVFPQRVLQT